MVRASQVSKRWRELLNDDVTWKDLCYKHEYKRRQSWDSPQEEPADTQNNWNDNTQLSQPIRPSPFPVPSLASLDGSSRSFPGSNPGQGFKAFPGINTASKLGRPVMSGRHKSFFKQRYLVETAWRTGGRHSTRQITQDQGVVTSLHLTPNYIVVALDNAKIHVFNTDGGGQVTLQGHVMGVWAMVPWGDTLVSGGCDRDVRVWNMRTG